MTRLLKKFIITISAFLLLIVLAIIIAPNFFKDKLISVVKKELNTQIVGTTDFTDVQVSWWNSFPDVSLTLEDVKLSGNQKDSLSKNLIEAEIVQINFDLMSVIKNTKSLDIHSFKIKNINANIEISNNGHANYSILRTAPEESSDTLTFNIEDYSIENANISYTDLTNDLYFETKQLDHTGQLNYNGNHVKWNAAIISPITNLTQQRIAYLNNTEIEFNGAFNYDINNNILDILENDLRLNEIALYLDGKIDQEENKTIFNVNIRAKENSFKQYLSIIPSIYSKDFKQLEANGNVEFGAYIKGDYNSIEQKNPKYSVIFKVNEGTVKLPGKTLAIDKINFNGSVKNNTKSFSPIQIEIPVFNLSVNDQNVSGKANINMAGGHQFFDTNLKGKINLADIQNSFPLESVETMSGLIETDINLKGNSKAIAQNDLSQLVYDGYLKSDKINIKMTEYPAIQLDKINTEISQDRLEIKNIKGTIGKSDFNGNLTLNSINSLLLNEGKKTIIDIKSNGKKLDLNELSNTSNSQIDKAKETTVQSFMPRYENYKINADLKYGQILYDSYELNDNQIKLSGNLVRLDIVEFKTSMHKEPIQGQGSISNIADYLNNKNELQLDFDIDSKSLDLDKWFPAEADSENQVTNYQEVPKKINAKIDFRTNRLKYDNTIVENVNGRINVKDEQATISNFKGKTLEGNFTINGAYKKELNKNPLFNLDVDLANLSYYKTFQQIDFAKKFAPLIEFISGNYNTKINFEGVLGEDYMPDLSMISGLGSLETLEGNIQNIKILQKLSDLLNVNELKELNLNKTKNKFAVSEGKVTIHPFVHEFKDIVADVSGSYLLNGGMNMLLKINIPKEKFNSKGIPKIIKDQTANVKSALNKQGIKFEESNMLKVDVFLTGSLADPKIELKLVDYTKQNIKDVLKETTKQVAQKVRDTVETEVKKGILDAIHGKDTSARKDTTIKAAIKDKVKKEVDKKVDEVIKPAKDSLIKKAEDGIKDKVGEVIDDKVSDDVKDKGQDLLDKYNPFKKKKK